MPKEPIPLTAILQEMFPTLDINDEGEMREMARLVRENKDAFNEAVRALVAKAEEGTT